MKQGYGHIFTKLSGFFCFIIPVLGLGAMVPGGAWKSLNQIGGMYKPCQIGYSEFGCINKTGAMPADMPWSKGLKKKKLAEIKAQVNTAQFPPCFAEEKIMEANALNLRFLTMFAISRFTYLEEPYLLVEIPAAANEKLPECARPKATIYMIFRANEVSMVRGYDPALDGLPDKCYAAGDFYPGKKAPCIITNYFRIEADYDLGKNSTWTNNLGDLTVKTIRKYTNRAYWPRDLADDQWMMRHPEVVKYYKATAVAKITDPNGNKYIIQLDDGPNRHMPKYLRTNYGTTFYLVVGEKGLDLSRGYDEVLDGIPHFRVEGKFGNGDSNIVELIPGELRPCHIVKFKEAVRFLPYMHNNQGQLLHYLDSASVKKVIVGYLGFSWPSVIGGMFIKKENEILANDYVAYACARFITEDSDLYYVLSIPSKENTHMPKKMIPEEDMFMVIGPRGVEFPEIDEAVADTARGVELIPCKMVDADKIDPNFDLALYKERLLEYIDSQTMETIVDKANPDYWPEGLKTSELRAANKDHFVDYRMYAFAEILAENQKIYYVVFLYRNENEHMPADMIPGYSAIMIVVEENGLEFKEEETGDKK